MCTPPKKKKMGPSAHNIGCILIWIKEHPGNIHTAITYPSRRQETTPTSLIGKIPTEQYPDSINIQLGPLPYTAAAAKLELVPSREQDLNHTLEQYNTSLDDWGPLISERILLKGTHPLLGMGIIADKMDNPKILY
jgi:hypothetical protein